MDCIEICFSLFLQYPSVQHGSPHFNSSVQHKDQSFSAPKIRQFDTKNRHFNEKRQFNTPVSSTHEKLQFNTPVIPTNKKRQFNTPVSSTQKTDKKAFLFNWRMLNSRFFVLNWQVCWTDGLWCWTDVFCVELIFLWWTDGCDKLTVFCVELTFFVWNWFLCWTDKFWGMKKVALLCRTDVLNCRVCWTEKYPYFFGEFRNPALKVKIDGLPKRPGPGSYGLNNARQPGRTSHVSQTLRCKILRKIPRQGIGMRWGLAGWRSHGLCRSTARCLDVFGVKFQKFSHFGPQMLNIIGLEPVPADIQCSDIIRPAAAKYKTT